MFQIIFLTPTMPFTSHEIRIKSKISRSKIEIKFGEPFPAGTTGRRRSFRGRQPTSRNSFARSAVVQRPPSARLFLSISPDFFAGSGSPFKFLHYTPWFGLFSPHVSGIAFLSMFMAIASPWCLFSFFSLFLWMDVTWVLEKKLKRIKYNDLKICCNGKKIGHGKLNKKSIKEAHVYIKKYMAQHLV